MHRSFAFLSFAVVLAVGCIGERPREPRASDATAAGGESGSAPAAGAGSPGALDVAGTTAPASGGFSSVVVLEPVSPTDVGAGGPAETAASPFMDQIANAFYPPMLVAPVGRPVDFWNSEGVMHNVNVTDDAGGTVFNIATPPGFESYQHTFVAPGVYRVSCDIHPNMTAFIVAVSTPYAAVAAPDGTFSIPGVPPGTYRASVWSLDAARRVTRAVEIDGASGALDLR